MPVAIIGATGHTEPDLVPRLRRPGHHVDAGAAETNAVYSTFGIDAVEAADLTEVEPRSDTSEGTQRRVESPRTTS